jgi:hypothetical protein
VLVGKDHPTVLSVSAPKEVSVQPITIGRVADDNELLDRGCRGSVSRSFGT